MKGMISASEGQVAKAGFDFSIAAKWIAYAQVKQSSIAAYEKGLKRLREYFAANQILNPCRADLLAYREYLGKRYAARTANLYLTTAKLFFSFLHTENYLPTNPAEHLKGFKVAEGHAKSAMTIDDTKKVIAKFDTTTLKGLRDKAMYALMTACGLRCVEVRRANISDIEIVGSVIRLHVQGKGRDDKTEAVNVPAGVYRVIREYLEKRGAVETDAPLFASVSNQNYGERMTVVSISRIIKGALRDSGFDSPRLTAHSLRHTAATAALSSGANIREVQKLLRHKNVAVTEIYLHELDDLNNRASSLAAAAFGF